MHRDSGSMKANYQVFREKLHSIENQVELTGIQRQKLHTYELVETTELTGTLQIGKSLELFEVTQ